MSLIYIIKYQIIYLSNDIYILMERYYQLAASEIVIIEIAIEIAMEIAI